MSCVRKRGNSWNAQVRVFGWRSFTKSFNKKTETILYTITFDCFSKKDLSEVSSFIKNNFKWE